MKTLLLFTSLFLSTLLAANPFVKPSEPNGTLVLSVNHQSKDIFPVVLYEIDGKQINVRENKVWLKPGIHKIRVRSTIDYNLLNKSLVKRQKFNSKLKSALEVNVEEGKDYYVGYDASSRDPNLWKPVVWKVK